jgi:hypothetical protein
MAKLAKPDAASGENDTAITTGRTFEDAALEADRYVAHLRAVADELEANIAESRLIFGHDTASTRAVLMGKLVGHLDELAAAGKDGGK